jgi:hypothetical protein
MLVKILLDNDILPRVNLLDNEEALEDKAMKYLFVDHEELKVGEEHPKLKPAIRKINLNADRSLKRRPDNR